MKSIFLFYFNGLPLTILLILVVLGLRYIFRKQSKRTLNYIWILLLVRLLVPFSLPADFSVIPNSSEILGIEENNIGAQNKDTEKYANSGRTSRVENTVESGDSSGNTAVYKIIEYVSGSNTYDLTFEIRYRGTVIHPDLIRPGGIIRIFIFS